VDNVAFGFLLVGRDRCVEEGFTRSCAQLFGKQVDVGARVATLFGMASERERQSFELALGEIFEDIMPEDVLLDQLPRRFPLPNGRVLSVDPRVIRDATAHVTSILLTVSDTTALEAARRESRKNRVLVDLLRQKPSFVRFLADTVQDVQEARSAFRRGDAVVVRRVVHTLKGNAASYGLDDQVAVIHALEERPVVDLAALDEIEASFRDFLEQSRHVLELDYDQAERDAFELSAMDAERLRSLSRHEPPDGSALRRWTANVLRHPVSLIVGPIDEFAQKLALRLGKTIDFRFEGADVLVDPSTMGLVLRNVVHLVRNAIDHAIEPPGERGAKAADGSVKLVVAETDREYTILVEDDGRGIATELLVVRATASGLVSPEQASALTDAEKQRLVFLDSVSTAAEATDISGRGIGLSAVQAAVRGAGGTIDVESQVDRGTRFLLRIPKPEPLRPATIRPGQRSELERQPTG